jgi:hypothetical protein
MIIIEISLEVAHQSTTINYRGEGNFLRHHWWLETLTKHCDHDTDGYQKRNQQVTELTSPNMNKLETTHRIGHREPSKGRTDANSENKTAQTKSIDENGIKMKRHSKDSPIKPKEN